MSAEAKWREIYNDEEQMKVIYNKWEVWIDTKGKEIKIGVGVYIVWSGLCV